jgi:hypothetical protein
MPNAKIKMKNDTRRSFKREMRDERRGDRMKLARPD